MENLLAQSGFLTTLVSDLTSDQRFVLVVIGIACLTAVLITVIIAVFANWAAIRERESRFELTRDLLDQGKTAEEIEKIVRPSDGFTRSMEHWFSGGRHKR